MKQVQISKPGQGNDPNSLVRAELLPGTTARDALRTLGLDGNYLLAKFPAPGQAPSSFGETESIYDKVGDGEKLLAFSKADVG